MERDEEMRRETETRIDRNEKRYRQRRKKQR